MRFETLFLRALFGACTLVCVLMLAAMITTQAPTTPAATSHAIAASATGISADHSRTAG